MDNINVYLQNSNNGFWYDHGVELGAAIVTLIAFLFTFWNINHTNKKQEIEEQKKNEKTLKMIDLVTDLQVRNINGFTEDFNEILEKTPDDNGHYYVYIEKIFSGFATKIQESLIVHDCCKYIIKNKLSEQLILYSNNIKEMLVNQHTNLNLNSLEKVTTKLEDIEIVIKDIEELTSYENISNLILEEKKEIIEKEFVKYKKINKDIEKISAKLI